MEINITTKQILKLLHILSWIIFIGVCVQAGGFIVNAFLSLAINPANARHFWDGADLSGLYNHDPGYFLVFTFIMSIVAIMKALIFYLIVKILYEKKLNLSQPFNNEVGRFIFNISYLTLGIGLFSHWGVKYAGWFAGKGVKMPDIDSVGLEGAGVWLFMSVTLYVIAQIFKRGIEIQSENELTI